MDEESPHWLRIDGFAIGRAWPDDDPITVQLDPMWTVNRLRAIADFLDQLAGADLLSSVVEG
jgi:hypothetical protein